MGRGAPSTSTARPNRFGRKTMLCIWWNQKVWLWAIEGETVNTKRYQQQLIDLNCSLLKKRSEYQKRQHKVIFLHDNAPIHTAKPIRDWKHSAGKFYLMRLTHQTWLLLITTCLHHDGSRTCWAGLWFVRRCEKMTRWMVRGKRGRFLLAWYPQIARKMEKCITTIEHTLNKSLFIILP